MRYKVQASDDSTFGELRKYLEQNAELYVVSPRRRMLSTGELSKSAMDEIRGRGGEVFEDRQYDPG